MHTYIGGQILIRIYKSFSSLLYFSLFFLVHLISSVNVLGSVLPLPFTLLFVTRFVGCVVARLGLDLAGCDIRIGMDHLKLHGMGLHAHTDLS